MNWGRNKFKFDIFYGIRSGIVFSRFNISIVSIESLKAILGCFQYFIAFPISAFIIETRMNFKGIFFWDRRIRYIFVERFKEGKLHNDFIYLISCQIFCYGPNSHLFSTKHILIYEKLTVQKK